MNHIEKAYNDILIKVKAYEKETFELAWQTRGKNDTSMYIYYSDKLDAYSNYKKDTYCKYAIMEKINNRLRARYLNLDLIKKCYQKAFDQKIKIYQVGYKFKT